MKKILILAFLLLSLGTYAQREVPQSRMEQIYEEAKTPYKYIIARSALAPTFFSFAILAMA